MDCVDTNEECYHYITSDLIDKDIVEKAISLNPFNITDECIPKDLINLDIIYFTINSLHDTIREFISNNDLTKLYFTK